MTRSTDAPLVSVVMPAFNVEWCVRRAVDSVLAQTLPRARAHRRRRRKHRRHRAVSSRRTATAIRVINQENRGMSAARNAGIRAARGAAGGFHRRRRLLAAREARAAGRAAAAEGPRSASAPPRRGSRIPSGEFLNLWQCRQQRHRRAGNAVRGKRRDCRRLLRRRRAQGASRSRGPVRRAACAASRIPTSGSGSPPSPATRASTSRSSSSCGARTA